MNIKEYASLGRIGSKLCVKREKATVAARRARREHRSPDYHDGREKAYHEAMLLLDGWLDKHQPKEE